MGRRYFPWLLALLGLFVFRVLAQLVQAIGPIPLLPPFAAWHGAVMPYPLLVAAQAAIVLVMAQTVRQVRADAIVPTPWRYRACYLLGGIHFAVMAVRLVAGLTVLADHPWFAKSLPAAFHLVLATFVLTLGRYLHRRARALCGDAVPAALGESRHG